MKKFTSLFLSFVMLFSIASCIPFTALADTFGDYEYTVLENNTIEITKYTGKDSAITVPAQINGVAVTAIGKSAITNKAVTAITLPEGITTLKEGALAGENVKTVYLPASIKSIYTSIASTIVDKNGCSETEVHPDVYYPLSIVDLVLNVGYIPAIHMHYGIKSEFDNYDFFINNKNTISISHIKSDEKTITIPAEIGGIKVTDLDVIMDKNLKKLVLGKNIDTLKSVYIQSAPKITLESIEVDAKNPYFASVNGVLFNKNKTSLIKYPAARKNKSYTIPNTVKKIEDFSFTQCSNLTSLTLGKNVASFNATNMSSLSGMKLKEIKVNKSNKYFTAKSGVLFDKKMKTLLFYPGKKTASSYTVPKTVKTIAPCAFVGNTNLKSIKIYGNIKFIEKNAPFHGCKNLKNIYYGGSKTQFGKIAYHGAKNKSCTYKNSQLKKLMNNAKIRYNSKIK